MEVKIESIKMGNRIVRRGEPAKWQPKLYVEVKGSHETLDGLLMARHMHDPKYYKKNVLPLIFSHIRANADFMARAKNVWVSEAAFFDPKNWGWSRKCGCSMCPCSPGFILKKEAGYGVLDIWASFSITQ